MAALVVAFLLVGCGGGQTTESAPSRHATPVTSRTDAPASAPQTAASIPASTKSGAGPLLKLRELASARHATYVAGPLRGRTGLYAAYAVLLDYSAGHNPHSRLVLLRWHQGAWGRDGQLRAVRTRLKHLSFWDFPDNDLRTSNVRGASAQAPVFYGGEGGGGGYGLMVAVRQHGHWRWARFRGCATRTRCPEARRHAISTENGRIAHRKLVSVVPDCSPSCGTSQVAYRLAWAWRPGRREFVLVHRATLHRPVVSNVVLGYRRFDLRAGIGWGTVEPGDVEISGDGTAGVFDLQWTGWGTPSAVGRGRFNYILNRGGHTSRPGELRAVDLGTCHGRPAYRRVQYRLFSKAHPHTPLRWHPYVSERGNVCRTASTAF